MAAIYHPARPAYPAALVDALVALSGLAPGDRVLEIGAGTGIATAALAARGLGVVAVERAPELAAVARAAAGARRRRAGGRPARGPRRAPVPRAPAPPPAGGVFFPCRARFLRLPLD